MLLLLALCCFPVLLLFCNKALSVPMCLVCKLVSLGNKVENSLQQNEWCRVIVWLCFAMFYYNISCCCSFSWDWGLWGTSFFHPCSHVDIPERKAVMWFPFPVLWHFSAKSSCSFCLVIFSSNSPLFWGFSWKWSRIILWWDKLFCTDIVEQLGDGRWYVQLAAIWHRCLS